jgi:putative SOS response-associated peptidase YedK
MCATYWLGLDNDGEEYKEIVRKLNEKYGSGSAEKYNNIDLYPKAEAPVIGRGDKVSLLTWGFPLSGKSVLFNARSESLADKPLYRGILDNRCLVPASGFYEWDRDKNKLKFEPEDYEIFYLAALWKPVKNADGTKEFKFVIITTEPNGQMSLFHDRMPAIITPDNKENWLDNNTAAFELLEPYDGVMSVNKVD